VLPPPTQPRGTYRAAAPHPALGTYCAADPLQPALGPTLYCAAAPHPALGTYCAAAPHQPLGHLLRCRPPPSPRAPTALPPPSSPGAPTALPPPTQP
jgi:hypothetical protein